VSFLVRQRGLLLCRPNSCWDDPLIWNRPTLIAQLLNWGADEEMALADILKDNLNTDMEDEFV
jgi:hypothetical protein